MGKRNYIRSMDRSLGMQQWSQNDPFVRGAYHKSQVDDIRNNMFVGDTVSVLRPMPTDSGALTYHRVKAKILAKYYDWFLVMDIEDFKYYSQFGTNMRKWGVRYEDLLSNQIAWYGRSSIEKNKTLQKGA